MNWIDEMAVEMKAGRKQIVSPDEAHRLIAAYGEERSRADAAEAALAKANEPAPEAKPTAPSPVKPKGK